MKNQKFRAWVVLIALNLMNFAQVVEAATITLSTAPLANATTTVVRPNILYILDNSGSMQWDYLPDYVSSGTGGTGSQICWEDNRDSNDLDTCVKVGGSDSNSGTSGYDVAVPFAASDINYAYYNPNTYYQPPIKADGTSYNAANPLDADTDGFSGAGSTNLVTATTIASLTGAITTASTNVTGLASSAGLVGSFVTSSIVGSIPANTYVVAAPTATSITLSTAATANGSPTLTFKAGGYKHQVFCNTGSPTTQQKLGGTVCKETSDTTTDSHLLFPDGTFNQVNSYNGAPYYYTMSPMQYCTTSTYTNCQPLADATHTIPALYRWCQTYTPGSPPSYSNCQDLRNATHTIPDYLGGQLISGIAAAQSKATLTVSSYTAGLSITGLTINGVAAFAPTFTPIVAGVTSGANSAIGIAQLICTAVHANRISSGYECPTNPTTSDLVIKATIPSAGIHASYTAPDGYVVQVNGPVTNTTTGTTASGTLQINSVAGATQVDDITVGGTTSILTVKPQRFAAGTTTTTIANTLAGLIGNGYTATNAGNVITITAVAEGINTSAIALTGSNVSATATINVGTTGQTAGTPASLGGISVGATGIVGALTSANLPNGTATTTNASTIRAAVGNGYTATVAGSVVTVTAPVATGNTLNGTSFTFTAGTAVPPTAAVTQVFPTGLITFGGTTTGNSAQINDTLTPGSVSVFVGTIAVNNNDIAMGNNRTPAQVASSVQAAIGTGGTVKAYIGGNNITPTCDPLPASVVCLVDNSATITNGKAVTVGTRTNFGGVTTAMTATAGGVAGVAANPGVTNFAPALSTGSAFGGNGFGNAGFGYSAQTATGSNMGSAGAGAFDQGTIATNATVIPSTLVLGGGVNPASAGRVNVGKFKRVDIVPTVNSYPATGTKDSSRIDCAGTTCTYVEERQNFANWYSYYRTRMLMMKSSSTLAFDQLDSKYRVGFDLLSHYQNNTVDLEVAQFVDSGGEVTNQRSTWWDNLVDADGSSGTPLRSSLLKAGKYYAGKLTTAAAVPAAPEVRARAYIDIRANTSDGATVSSVVLDGVQILGSTFTVSGCAGSCSGGERATVAGNLASAIAARIALGAPTYTGPAYTVSSTSYTSGGNTVGRVVITAPVGTGQTPNGSPLSATSGGTINLTAIGMTGGVNATAAIPATVVEPIQYSCQQNYTLLVTDGYWNSDDHDDLTLLSGSGEIGNQDNVNTGLAGRPSYDGALASATCVDGSFSSCGTLADIAMYYYKTDLRDASLGNNMSSASSLDVSENNVFKSPTDSNQNQHMTLFTMALGAPGTLRYRSDYQVATSGDYYDIATVAVAPAVQKNWPAVKENDPTTIDDLWHAAVNGRGKYFSARDPNSVVSGLVEALSGVQVREGSAAAAATSNLEPVAGDNYAYVATYTTQEWSGDLQARYIDLTSGAVSEPLNAEPNECVSDAGCAWSAKKKLDSASWGARNIYMVPSTPTPGSVLRDFTFGNLSGAEAAYFDPSTLNQYASIFATNPTDITAAKMMDFLRGDRSLEVGNLSSNPEVWRNREHVLGDIVSTQPIFVSEPRSSYQDAGYAAFVTAQASREGVVYVSGNDGMLHAFASDDFADASANGGDELWAYIPTQQLPHLKDLADTNYTHHYYLDGQITVGDVNFGGGSSDWHTILVGGMGGGGTAYYALDITDPVNPKYLWEFTATNLGYTYGNATINKLPNGEWAVLFTSGYNNADGIGYLYAVNPQTGAVKTGFPISTGSGAVASPSNLGKVSAWVDNSRIDNTATHIYGGDMEGDFWRFDLTTKAAFKLAHFQDAEGTPNPQPITTKPEMTLIDGERVIYVGTGRYIALTDLPDTNVQSFYAIKDTLGGDNITAGGGQVTWNPRDDTVTPIGNLFLERKLISTTSSGAQITTTDALGNTVAARKICTGAGSSVDNSTGNCVGEPTSPTEMDWGTFGGWYFDLADSGERMNVDMNLTFGTLSIPTNVPASSACTTGGYGYLNFIDFKTGLAVVGEDFVSLKISNSLIVGINALYVNGKLVVDAITSSGGGLNLPAPGDKNKFLGVRDLWRELNPY